MSLTEPAFSNATESVLPADGRGALIAAVIGTLGGLVGAWLAGGALPVYGVAGAGLGLVGAVGLKGRATDVASGLVWGLGGGFLLWVILVSGHVAGALATNSTQAMVRNVQARLPELFACVLCIGGPIGIALGLRSPRGTDPKSFLWGRSIVVGGGSGVVAALIFSRWMYEGDFFPLIAGLASPGSQLSAVLLHVAVACFIGCTFGMVFQDGLRSLGSSMGWGMAYAMVWWILGPMTLFPVVSGQRPDWSAEHAGELFGPWVGYLFYGLILGVVYCAVNAVWNRLFVDSDPLNRKREGPGLRLLQSLGWGSAAGLAGGLVALPLMIQTGVISKLAGVEGGTPLLLAIPLHLAVSTAIGASYGFLFRDEASDVISCSLWGCMLGVIGWYAGPLTLLPLLRTGQCDWRPEAAGALLPLLVAHLLFGVITANGFSAFERATLRRSMALRARTPEPRAGDGDSRPTAPLCLIVVGLGILLPLVLG